MTTANDPIKNIQSRIDELEETISERGDQIRERTRQLKEDLQEELSPVEMLKRHPVEAAGVSFVTGIVAGRIIRSLFFRKTGDCAPASQPQVHAAPHTTQVKQPSPAGVAAGAIGVELLHTFRDLGITWLKSRVEEKKK
ncbi:hypothetical protein EST62_09705 [Chlorobaculum sp. 24CR]|uniref:hypothetical protein n=1 Tax=Chlorobaculum sp. 24CR TaxID=2508878 RepID=UPI00100B2495|nr:hypothetical protein [Chlorobaculum sp. 24CR]RXK84319.1 hypothetical protein EST62_09705 [Chlorobaculum sp. 24CR]